MFTLDRIFDHFSDLTDEKYITSFIRKYFKIRAQNIADRIVNSATANSNTDPDESIPA